MSKDWNIYKVQFNWWKKNNQRLQLVQYDEDNGATWKENVCSEFFSTAVIISSSQKR